MNAWAIAGIVVAALILIVLIRLYPELRRYLHLRSM
jgi:membrane protein YdbS with pleckstrin-like domain